MTDEAVPGGRGTLEGDSLPGSDLPSARRCNGMMQREEGFFFRPRPGCYRRTRAGYRRRGALTARGDARRLGVGVILGNERFVETLLPGPGARSCDDLMYGFCLVARSLGSSAC